LYRVVNFLKRVAAEVLFSIVAFKTLTFHKVVWQQIWGMVRSLEIVLLKMFSWCRQWN